MKLPSPEQVQYYAAMIGGLVSGVTKENSPRVALGILAVVSARLCDSWQIPRDEFCTNVMKAKAKVS
jgi:hypothetical protein